jgi:hypothetical protein
MPLIELKAEPAPRLAGWLYEGNSTELGRAIVARAFLDVGITEVPLGSNRGTRIDTWAKRAGLPVSQNGKANGPGWWWCALWAGAVFIDCGVKVPKGYPSCDAWIPYLSPDPIIGAAILYGLRKRNAAGKVTSIDAHHIGIVARLDPLDLTIEGNRGYAGTTNNGVAVDIGPQQRKDVLGYYHPVAA